MSSRISRFSVVALVALAAVIVCIVFVVLRLVSPAPLDYVGEIHFVERAEIPLFAADVSTISVPIKADFAALGAQIRKAVMPEIPTTIATGKERVIGLYDLHYTATLLSLDIALTSMPAGRPVMMVTGTLRVSGPVKDLTVFHSEWGKYNGEFRFRQAYPLALDKNAKMIVAPTEPVQVTPTRGATLKFLGVTWDDWAGLLKKAVLPKVRKKVDEKMTPMLKEDRLTPLYKKGWEALHNPINLTSGVWLVFHPEGFEVAQLRSSGTMLETTVTVRGRPKVVLGDKPQLPEAPSMPAVQLGEAKGGLHLVVDAIAPLDEAERLLNKELGELEKVVYDQANVKVKVPKARIYSRENRLRLELLVTRPFRGSVFLEGAPMYDAENNELYVEGLDCTAETKNLLASSASLLLKNRVFKDYLQKKVRLPVGGPLAKVGESISGYETEVADGVVFKVGNTSFKMLGVYNTREAMHLIVQADGSAEVTIV